MLGARDEGLDRLGREGGVHVGPHAVRVVDDRAVDHHLRRKRMVPVDRGEFERITALVRGKDDAVIADADFDDVGHAGLGTDLDFTDLDLAARVGDVDGVLAHPFAEPLETSGRTARFHDRGREIEILAKGLGDDRGIGQDGRGSGDLNAVARSGDGGGCGDQRERGGGEFECGHRVLLSGCVPLVSSRVADRIAGLRKAFATVA
jgi:hypothetical protein